MKNILGLDLGVSSIGWALIESPEDKSNEQGKILGMGSRIISLGKDKTNYEQGLALTKNADRRIFRGTRKLNKRYKQRRNKLVYVLKELGMLPDYIKWNGEFPDAANIQKLNLLPISKNMKQINALELYELRARAIKERIELKELGRLLYLFNQLRGYNGGDYNNEEKAGVDEKEEENKTDLLSYNDEVKIISIKKNINKRKAKRRNDNEELIESEITVITSAGEEITGRTTLSDLIENETYELWIKHKRNKKGDITSTEFRLPFKSNWRKQMEDFEADLIKEGEPHLGEYFYQKLTENKWFKVRKKVILRQRYIKEFDAIWDEQSKYYNFLNDPGKDKLINIASFLFPGTKESQQVLRDLAVKNNLKYIIKEQIIYYQLPLKSQFKYVGNCAYEKELKVLPQSHPDYQEFRIWNQINNLSINTATENNGKIKYKDRFLNNEEKNLLYQLLNEQNELSFASIRKKLNLRDNVDYLNGMHAKARLKGNTTLLTIKNQLGAYLFDKLNLSRRENIVALWRVLYNWIKEEYDEVVINNEDYEQAPANYHTYDPKSDNEYDIQSGRLKAVRIFLESVNMNNELDEDIVKLIGKIRFKRKYGALSGKAINKILPLMRTWPAGNHQVELSLKDKLHKIANGITNEKVPSSLIEYINNSGTANNGGMIYSFAALMVYGNQGEEIINHYAECKSYKDIKTLEQRKIEDPANAYKYSLRNPVAEQITNECLQIVKQVWKQYGKKPDEIRIELARELKNSAEERNRIYSGIINSEKENKRIVQKLIELKKSLSPENTTELKIPPTKDNIEKYKIWDKQFSNKVDKKDIEKYKLWESQEFLSPYTGKPIPLCKLFTNKYEKDHIIPKSRYFDDSQANKVICEASVNQDKGNRTAWEYITSGSAIETVLDESAYIEHINRVFFGHKRKILLTASIPKDPIERQIKNTQYISKKVKAEMGKVVGLNNVMTTTGSITDYLRQHWGLNDLFKEITKDRFITIGKLFNEEWAEYEYDEEKNKKTLKIKNWGKRYDHRHHAIDALIIACTKQKDIQKLNNLNQELQSWLSENKHILLNNVTEEKNLLELFISLRKEKREKVLREMKGSIRYFNLPWKGFIEQAKEKLLSIVISHKSKNKLVIQKDRYGNTILKIRGELHEQTLYGKNETYRIPLNKLKNKNEDFLRSNIVSKSVAEELINHLHTYKADAFTREGIMSFNKQREERQKHPVYSINIRYSKKEEGYLQPLNRKNYKPDTLFVKTGSNYCFAIAEKDGERKYGIITLFDAAKYLASEMKNGNGSIDAIIKKYFTEICEATKGCKLLFSLIQNDLVYLPNDPYEYIPMNENEDGYHDFWKNNIDNKRIFRVVKMREGRCYFISNLIAEEIKYAPCNNMIIEGSTSVINKEISYEACSEFYTDAEYLLNLSKARNKKEIIKKRKEEINNLIKLNDTQNDLQLVSKLAQIVNETNEYNMLKYIKDKNKEVAAQVDKEVLKYKAMKNTFTRIKIQESCIKIFADHLGNIRPFK